MLILAGGTVPLVARIASLPPVSGAGPRRGGILRLTSEVPHTIDPAKVDSVYDALPADQIFDGLVSLDPSLSLVPALADTWTISRDGRTYTFHLRAGVRFHDGSPLSAADVVFTIRRILEPGRRERSIAASYLEVVDGAREFMASRRRDLPGVNALGSDRVEIRLVRPYVSFLEVLAMDDLRIVPKAAVSAAGEDGFSRAPVGTGPFRFVSWTENELRLVANPDYFGGAPYLYGVVVRFPDPAEPDRGNQRFLRHETDLVEPLPDTLPALQQDPTVRIHRYQELSLQFLGLQLTRPEFADLRVRQAIAHAIDRKGLAGIAPASRREATGILPPGLPGYSPAPKALAYDPEQSRRLLAEAGHPNGEGLPAIVAYVPASGGPAETESHEALRRDLEAVGIHLDLREVRWPELNRRIDERSAPVFQLGWVADLADPDSFLRSLFEPGGAANFFAFRDSATAEALERGAGEMNPAERARIYRDLEKSILEKVPMVPLYLNVGLLASRSYVNGFKPGPMGFGMLDLRKTWIDPGEERR